jgi:hypothetical protein
MVMLYKSMFKGIGQKPNVIRITKNLRKSHYRKKLKDGSSKTK